jgi:hypothetical protein
MSRIPTALQASLKRIRQPADERRTLSPSSYFLYRSPRENLKLYRPRYYLSKDTKVNVNPYDRWEMSNYARQVFAQLPEVGGAVRQKNQYAFGHAWDAHYAGKCTDQNWIEATTEFLHQIFLPNANLRGGPFAHFRNCLKISGYSMDYDGDDAMLLTEDELHFPKVTFVSSPRINSTQSLLSYGSGTVKDRFTNGLGQGGEITSGPFKGAKLFDGIIMDNNNRILGIRITGEDEQYTDISIFNADLRCDAEWHDQGRGIPLLGRPMLRFMNYQDTQEFLERAVKRIAAQNITARTKSGDAVESALNIIQSDDLSTQPPTGQTIEAGALAGSQAGTSRVHTELIEGGEILYMSTDSGEEIKGVEYQNPHPNTAEFLKATIQGGLNAIDWYIELIRLGDTGRASTRMLCDLGNASIRNRRDTLRPRWQRAVSYAIAKGMQNGLIPKNDDDPFSFTPGMPKNLSVDEGNDEQADRENLKMGTTSKHHIAQRHGHFWKQIDKERDEELKAAIDRANELVQYSVFNGQPQLSFEQAMELLEQRAPNPQAQFMQPAQPQAEPEPATK